VSQEGKFKGKLIVVTAPSGAGKTTIVKHLLKTYDFFDFSVSATTREKRKKEKEGKDYYFITTAEFKSLIKKRAFLEYEEVYEDQYYGTLKSEVDRIWSLENHIIFDIDVKGAVNLKKKYKDRCHTIFIKPPSLQVIIDRLTKRRTETEESLKKRIRRIKRELKYESKFDNILLNDVLDTTLKEAEILIESLIFGKTL